MSLRSRCFRRLGHVLRKIEHPVIVIHFFPQRREGPGAISQLLDLDNRSYVFGVSAARSIEPCTRILRARGVSETGSHLDEVEQTFARSRGRVAEISASEHRDARTIVPASQYGGACLLYTSD